VDNVQLFLAQNDNLIALARIMFSTYILRVEDLYVLDITPWSTVH
jgi:hypothetical protein